MLFDRGGQRVPHGLLYRDAGDAGVVDDVGVRRASTRDIGSACREGDRPLTHSPERAKASDQAVVAGTSSSRSPARAPGRSRIVRRRDHPQPVQGTGPFLEADVADFFGRELFIERLLERLSRADDQTARFVAVVGPSGSGKSSVVNAGLVAASAGRDPGSEGWFVTEMHPGRHPFEELDAALMRVAVRPPAGLLARLESGPRGLLEVADAIVPKEAELLLVVDQFEEAFTLTESEDERGAPAREPPGRHRGPRRAGYASW